jgi:hypothetical protein
MKKWLDTGLWAAVLAAFASVCFAQMNVAEISGIVTDPAGDVVTGAAITATNSATGLKFNAATNDSGRYLLTQLSPGAYSVSVSAAGFKLVTQSNVILHAGEQMALPFSMIIGAKTDTVIVEERPAVLQTESAQIKDVIENQQVVDLPVKDREFLELALLGPGVVNPPGGTRGDSLQQTGKLINIWASGLATTCFWWTVSASLTSISTTLSSIRRRTRHRSSISPRPTTTPSSAGNRAASLMSSRDPERIVSTGAHTSS